MSEFASTYLQETIEIVEALDVDTIDRVAVGLAGVHERNGRLFVLGVGGSAGHASHAVNDFRKLCGIETYAPTDNVSELTARINDEGWETSLSGWLEVSRLGPDDAVLIFSVGGGDADRNISPNLVSAIGLAKRVRASVYGIVGRDGGSTARATDAVVVIPPLHAERITPHTEGLCAVVWHLLVSHPSLQRSATKWEIRDDERRTMIDGPYRHVVVIGGAGFIGSHMVRTLMAHDDVQRVTVYDNFSSGRRWHLEPFAGDERLEIIEGEVHDLDRLRDAIRGAGAVVHLASNPDIARAMTDPTIDFDQGTYLTHCVVEAARTSSVGLILYASGSGVYGDLGEREADESYGPLEPVSTYGASKLAGETLISSYSHMFEMRGRAFRFGNVVGPNQTHGVGFDFVRKLLEDPTRLEILGDGSQSKSYVHVDDVLRAVLLAGEAAPEPFAVYNVATGDYITVTEIAQLAAECLDLDPSKVELVYAGGNRGWKGDVPVVRVATARIRALGWTNQRSSRDALEASMRSMLGDARAGRLW